MGSKNCEQSERLFLFSRLQDSKFDSHEDPLYLQKQRNKALENDVKMLQDRLKQLERSLETKGKKTRKEQTHFGKSDHEKSHFLKNRGCGSDHLSSKKLLKHSRSSHANFKSRNMGNVN
jgi:flagellar motility protein MotE (MotC chaperone)